VLFVDDVVEGLDLRRFEQRYAVLGERAYPQRMLPKLWSFGAIAGIHGGREIARRLFWDPRSRHPAGELRADFRTVDRFRERHHADFSALPLETVRIAQGFGLAKRGGRGSTGGRSGRTRRDRRR